MNGSDILMNLPFIMIESLVVESAHKFMHDAGVAQEIGIRRNSGDHADLVCPFFHRRLQTGEMGLHQKFITVHRQDPRIGSLGCGKISGSRKVVDPGKRKDLVSEFFGIGDGSVAGSGVHHNDLALQGRKRAETFPNVFFLIPDNHADGKSRHNEIPQNIR